MPSERPALGQRLAELVELGAIEFRPEPLNAIVERRLKEIWAARSCPHCEQETLQALDGSDRIWCSHCNWKTTYTRGTPFYESELAPGEFLIAFILYADSCSASTRSRFCSRRPTRRSVRTSESSKPPFVGGFRLSGTVSPRQSVARHRWMKPSRCVQGSKAKSRHEKGSTAAVRRRAAEHDGQESRETNSRSSRRAATCFVWCRLKRGAITRTI